MTLRGTLEKSDLEGGVWVFKTDDGGQYHLEGLKSGLLKNGKRLEVVGDIDQGGVSLGMMGAVFRVTQAREL